MFAFCFLSKSNSKIYKGESSNNIIPWAQQPAMNFTAHYLSRLNRRILDNFGNPIDTIKYKEQNLSFFYLPPSLEYDIMVVKAQRRTPVLRETKDINELKDYGFVVATMPAGNSKKFYKGQLNYIFIAKMGQLPVGAISINNFEVKKKYHLVIDDANKLAKLIGQNAGPNGEGPWIVLEN